MTYRVIDIEGLGELYAAKLGAAGVDTVEQLLERCKTPQGREALALETGISPKLILRWTNHADLFRIKAVVLPRRRSPVRRTSRGFRRGYR